MKKKWLIGALVIAIALPMACNLFIQCDSPNSIRVIGEQTDWLSFYGNYLGSIFAALASFIILYYTLKESRRESELAMRHQEIQMIVNDLSKRFGEYNVAEIIHLNVQVYPTKEKLEDELFRLQIMREKFSSLLYSGTLWYGNAKSESETLFFEDYSKLMSSTIRLIEDLIVFYSSIKKTDLEWNENHKQKMLEFADKIRVLSEHNNKVFYNANLYLQTITQEFNKYQYLPL